MDDDTTGRLAELYGLITNVYKARDIRTAEAAKVIENIQRDLNIALMNELAIIFHKMGLDKLFCKQKPLLKKCLRYFCKQKPLLKMLTPFFASKKKYFFGKAFY